MGLRPLACWDCGFESRRRHGCLSFVNVACWYVEVSATDRSLILRSPTECPVSVIYNLTIEAASAPVGLLRHKKKITMGLLFRPQY